MRSSHSSPPRRPRRPDSRRLSETGQSAVLLALMFMSLLVFVGLATDAGILYLSFGQLRRAADSAALSAAAQYREARPYDEIVEASTQFVKLQGVPVQPGQVVVETCESKYGRVATSLTDWILNPNATPTAGDPSICTYPVRKLVRVQVTTDVSMAFMQLFGWRDPVPLTTYAVSEAASIEIMLVIDTSFSMTYDAGKNLQPANLNGEDDDNDGCVDEAAGAGCDANGKNDNWLGNSLVNPAAGDNTPTCNIDPTTAGIAAFYTNGKLPSPISLPEVPSYSVIHSCRPFEFVRDAAIRFIYSFVKFPYDRVGIVTFADTAAVQQSLGSPAATAITDTLTTLTTVEVSGPTLRTDQPGGDPVTPYANCPVSSNVNYTLPTIVGMCQNTNTGDALKLALGDLQTYARSSALRFMILLSDGAATSSSSTSQEISNVDYYACNNNDGTKVTYDPSTNPYGDPYFALRPCSDGDSRDTVGIGGGRHNAGDITYAYDADDYARDQADIVANSKVVVVFSIGLGQEVTDAGDCSGGATQTVNGKTFVCDPDGGYASGEQLLRYIADVGDGDLDNDGSAKDGLGYGCNRDDSSPNDGLYTSTTGTSCGNYFYAQGGADVAGIFTEIASRIFTRITE